MTSRIKWSFEALRKPSFSPTHRVIQGMGSILEIWPPALSRRNVPDEVVIGRAWQFTGDALRDAMMEIEREQKQKPATEKIRAGQKIRAGRSSATHVTR